MTLMLMINECDLSQEKNDTKSKNNKSNIAN